MLNDLIGPLPGKQIHYKAEWHFSRLHPWSSRLNVLRTQNRNKRKQNTVIDITGSNAEQNTVQKSAEDHNWETRWIWTHKNQCTMLIMAIYSETLWAFPGSSTANKSRSGCASNVSWLEDKTARNFSIKVSFSIKINIWVVHDSDHDGVVRIFVGHSEVVKHYLD